MGATTTDKTPIELVFAATRRTPKLAKDVAADLGMTTQKVTAALRKLETAGAVSKDPEGGWFRMPGVRKLPVECAPVAAEPKASGGNRRRKVETVEVAFVEPAVQPEAAPVPDGPWDGVDGSDAAPGSVDAVLSQMQAVAPVSAPPAPTPRRRNGSTGPAIIKGNRSTQWGKGELVAAITAWMAARRGMSLSPTEVTAGLNLARPDDSAPIAQNGSVAFALDAMSRKGLVDLIQDKPRRYSTPA